MLSKALINSVSHRYIRININGLIINRVQIHLISLMAALRNYIFFCLADISNETTTVGS